MVAEFLMQTDYRADTKTKLNIHAFGLEFNFNNYTFNTTN